MTLPSGWIARPKVDRKGVKVSIEMSELILCKDCEFWEQQEKSLQGRCCLLQMYPTGEWFCGNGKRKENKQ